MLSRRLALAFFGIWLVFLTGLLGIFSKSPAIPPGVYQSMQLASLLNDRQAEISALRQELDALAAEERALRTNPRHQQREIRRVLGFTAPDEVIFDFSE